VTGRFDLPPLVECAECGRGCDYEVTAEPCWGEVTHHVMNVLDFTRYRMPYVHCCAAHSPPKNGVGHAYHLPEDPP
jgi:hypothetical protein